MEPDKSLKEALLRSHQATEKANQAQHQLQSMSTGQPEAETTHPKLHETPRNLLQSWDTLRQMDEELADSKSGGSPKNSSRKQV